MQNAKGKMQNENYKLQILISVISAMCRRHEQKPALCTDFSFDEKCSDFAEVRRFSAEKRMQFREIWAFIGNRRPYPHASGKTNLTKSAHSRLTARESSEKLP